MKTMRRASRGRSYARDLGVGDGGSASDTCARGAHRSDDVIGLRLR
jgi:hypothetical protein